MYVLATELKEIGFNLVLICANVKLILFVLFNNYHTLCGNTLVADMVTLVLFGYNYVRHVITGFRLVCTRCLLWVCNIKGGNLYHMIGEIDHLPHHQTCGK